MSLSEKFKYAGGLAFAATAGFGVGAAVHLDKGNSEPIPDISSSLSSYAASQSIEVAPAPEPRFKEYTQKFDEILSFGLAAVTRRQPESFEYGRLEVLYNNNSGLTIMKDRNISIENGVIIDHARRNLVVIDKPDETLLSQGQYLATTTQTIYTFSERSEPKFTFTVVGKTNDGTLIRITEREGIVDPERAKEILKMAEDLVIEYTTIKRPRA